MPDIIFFIATRKTLIFFQKKSGMPVADLIKKARIKFDWHIDLIQLGTQFLKIDELKDEPRMIIKTDINDVKKLFIAEAKKLKSEIIK